MKLQCNNCEFGPCNLESSAELLPNKHTQKRCYFRGGSIAFWQELSPKPEWDNPASDYDTLALKIIKKWRSIAYHNVSQSNAELQSLIVDALKSQKTEKVQLIAIDIGKEKTALELMLDNGLISDQYYNKSMEAILRRPAGIKIKLRNQEPKESNLIPFHKAAPLMKVGDKFKIVGEHFGYKGVTFEFYEGLHDDGIFFRSGNIEEVRLSPEHFNLMGEIIPAEPKVLTLDEVRNAIIDITKNEELTSYSYELKLIRKSDQNGQLKQWLNHKELREAVEELLQPTGRGDFIKISDAFENLKPLSPDE